MKIHLHQNSVVNILVATLIAAGICPAQSVQSGPASPSVGNAKPLMLEKSEGELRVRRTVSGAPSHSAAQPSAAVPFIFKVSPKSNGSEHLVVITEELPAGATIPKHKHLGQDEIVLVQTGTAHVWLGDEEGDLHAGGLVFIPSNSWITLKNTWTEPISLVAIFSAPGFDEYLRCRSVPANEKVTSIGMDEIKDCAHEGHVTFEAMEKTPNK